MKSGSHRRRVCNANTLKTAPPDIYRHASFPVQWVIADESQALPEAAARGIPAKQWISRRTGGKLGKPACDPLLRAGVSAATVGV